MWNTNTYDFESNKACKMKAQNLKIVQVKKV